MEKRLFLQNGNQLEVEVLERTDKFLRLKVLKTLRVIRGKFEEGAEFEVKLSQKKDVKSVASLLGDKDHRFELL